MPRAGREWLTEQLTEKGVDVQRLMCYERLPLELTLQQQRELGEAVRGPAPVTYITSSEAFVCLMRAMHCVKGAWEWLLSGAAVVIHPRSAQKAREAGFRIVRMSDSRDEEVVTAVQACIAEMQAQ